MFRKYHVYLHRCAKIFQYLSPRYLELKVLIHFACCQKTLFCLFEGWGRQKYSFPSPRVSIGGTRSFLSKNLPEHCTANHGVWIKCIFEQLDRISNVVVCLPQAGLIIPLSMQLAYWGGGGGTIWYKLARRRTNILHKQSGWILLRRVEKFLSAEMAPNSRQKLRLYAGARYKSQYTVKNMPTCPNFFSIIRARPPALTP